MYVYYIHIYTSVYTFISLCGLLGCKFFSHIVQGLVAARIYIYVAFFCSFREIGIKIKNSDDERPLKIPILTCV